MLSLPDMAILSVLALLIFGEQKLPGIMRQAGRVMREVQNTSQSFIREMERAADIHETPHAAAPRADDMAAAFGEHEKDEGGTLPPQS